MNAPSRIAAHRRSTASPANSAAHRRAARTSANTALRPDPAVTTRLRSTDGFTLGEVLATVVLVGLLTLAVAAGIGVAVNAYNDIRGYTEEQSLLNNAVTVVSDELRFAYDISTTDNISTTGNDPILFSSPGRDARFYLANDPTNGISLVGVPDPGDGTTPTPDPATAQTVPLPLINTAAGESGDTKLTARLTKLTYNNGLWTFAISVSGGDTTLTSGDLTVRSINTW